MYKKIFIAALFCGGKELEIEGMSINWKMSEQVVVYECNGILLYYKISGRLQRGLEGL